MSVEREIMIVPLRVGIRFNPPALIYIYERKNCDELFPSSVLRRRIMPIRGFYESTLINSFARDLLDRHGKMLFENVPIKTVCKMLYLLRKHRNGVDLKTAVELIEEEENDYMDIKKEIAEVNDMTNNSSKSSAVKQEANHSLELDGEKEESFGVEADRSWDDERDDDSLEIHLDGFKNIS